MQKDNIIRLRHMLEAAREAISFSENKTKSDLYSDRMLALSIIKSIEIIGEAASTVTKDFSDKHNESHGRALWQCETALYMFILI